MMKNNPESFVVILGKQLSSLNSILIQSTTMKKIIEIILFTSRFLRYDVCRTIFIGSMGHVLQVLFPSELRVVRYPT